MSSPVRGVGGFIELKDYFVPKPKSIEAPNQEALRELQMEEKFNEPVSVFI